MQISMSKKLFIFICITLIITILPLFYIARSALSRFGEYAYRVNEQQIEESSRFYLEKIAEEQAKTYDEIFKRIYTTSSLMGRQLTHIYYQRNVLSGTASIPVELTPDKQTGLFYSAEHQPVITVYWGGRKMNEEIKAELAVVSHFQPMLIKALENIPESLAAHMVSLSGIGMYYTTNDEARKACFDLPPTHQFDLRSGEIMTIFTENDTRYFDTRWTRIYKDDVIDGLMMTAVTPVYDSQMRFSAVTGIDVPVGYIIKDLIGSGSVFSHPGGKQFAFLLNKEHKIIAFPQEYLALFGLKIDLDRFENSSDIFNYSLEQSSIPQVRRLAESIDQVPYGVVEIDINNEIYLIAVGGLPSVEWYLVCAAKKKDLLVSLEKTGAAMEKSLKNIWKDFIGHSGLILVIAILLVLSAIRIFISPIRQFIQATRQVADGDFDTRLDENRDDEIGTLARSFNQMTRKLRSFENTVKEHADALEDRIRLRTLELEKSNRELSLVKESQEKIIAKRTEQLRKLNKHLAYTEENQRKAIASELHDGVTQSLAMSISKLKDIQETQPGSDIGRIEEVQGFLEGSVKEVRAIIYELRPPVLDDFSIDIALGFLVEQMNDKYAATFEYINNLKRSIELNQAVKVTLYRGVSELITNVLKHADTQKGTVEIRCEDDQIKISVVDEGSGFNPLILKNFETSGFGLKSLMERVENFGGKLEIASEPGHGTKIYLSIPVQRMEHSNNETD